MKLKDFFKRKIEKWERAFPNLNISLEEKKALYERLEKELQEKLPTKDIDFYTY